MKSQFEDSPTPYDDLPEVNSYDEIPAFANENEEDLFWSTHALGPGLLKTMRRGTVADALREVGFKGPLTPEPRKRKAAKRRA